MTVSPELHERVLNRDGQCFVSRFDPFHVCRDKWGVQHRADDLGQMTVDHVHLIPGGVRGKRAPDDEQHMVTMCAHANILGPSRAVREAEREYLKGLYGA